MTLVQPDEGDHFCEPQEFKVLSLSQNLDQQDDGSQILFSSQVNPFLAFVLYLEKNP